MYWLPNRDQGSQVSVLEGYSSMQDGPFPVITQCTYIHHHHTKLNKPALTLYAKPFLIVL